MSKHYYSYIGYGIKADNLVLANMEGVKNLAVLCDSPVMSLALDCRYMAEIESTEFTDCGDSGVAALFVEAVYNTEKIPLIIANVDEGTFILYEPSYPWQTRFKTEQELTTEKLDELFAKYQDILQIPKDKQAIATYQDVIGYC